MSLEVDIKKDMGSFKLDVSFCAGDETLGFLGASGCGKSLTLRCIAGIEKPDEGRIVVNGVTFFEKEAGRRARVDLTPQQRKTALLFQSYMLFPNMTVEQNVAAGMERGLAESEKSRIVGEQLKRFGLIGMEKRFPAQLSGGQQQRVAIARALAKNPKLLLCDEPTGALDYETGKAILKLLQDTCRDTGRTVVVVTHNSAFTAIADRVIHVREGSVAAVELNEAPLSADVLEW